VPIARPGLGVTPPTRVVPNHLQKHVCRGAAYSGWQRLNPLFLTRAILSRE